MKLEHIFSVGALALCLACGSDDDGDDGNADESSGGSAATQSTTDPTTTSQSTTNTTSMTTDSGSESESGGDSSSGEAVCMTDVCATYGPAVPTVAGAIVDQAATDPEFADFFAPLVAEGDDAVQAFKDSLANFISDAYGCTEGAYTGPDMPTAHAGMGITQMQYDDFIALIAGVLAGAGVPEDDINLCFAPPLVDPAFSAMIVGQ
jgi:truncated hemoglobin YjbI